MTLSALSVSTGATLLETLARILILLLALCVHEWAHAFAAVKCGDPTPKYAGRLTLNPIRHFEPFGFVMMLLVNVGFAKPVPINPANFRRPRRDSVWVSLAGVLSNLCMAFLFVMIYTCVATFAPHYVSSSLLAPYDGGNLFGFFLTKLLSLGVLINIALMVFNLLPIYPLDGFRVIEANTKYNNRYRNFMYRRGTWILMGLLLESVVMNALYRSTGIEAFYYLDLLGNLISWLSSWIIWPIEQLWWLFWGIF